MTGTFVLQYDKPIFGTITVAEAARRYLASQGLVAIDRRLAENLAKLDGGVACDLMVYDAGDDTYRPSGVAKQSILERVKVR